MRGEFTFPSADGISYLYFPLANEAGMMCSITPTLHGDIKAGQHAYLMPPASAEDLHESRWARNFWVYVDGYGPWSASGNSARQVAMGFSCAKEDVTVDAGFLWHRVTRASREALISAEITNFVPVGADRVELMLVKVTNTGAHPRKITPTAAIPMYCRSADNIRDHRHVTSLLNRARTTRYGVTVTPTMSFDERGHRPNRLTYAVLGADEDGAPPVGTYPALLDFVGEGGNLEWPRAVVENADDWLPAGANVDGYEAAGALRFEKAVLRPGESRSYVIAMAISEDNVDGLAEKYCSAKAFEEQLAECCAHWERKVGGIAFHGRDPQFDAWMRWVTLQPMLRRIYGCSFLPHHDYGKGGRGWRDLWQDCLAVLLLEPEPARELLLSGLAGVRIDGSNATIIGHDPGEFVADRNGIPRVWMDHGAWPYLAVRMYIDLTGDIEFLLSEQRYFRDGLLDRAQRRDERWNPAEPPVLRRADGAEYLGSVLEHLLVPHLVQFFNVGEHNSIRLEGADWNDALDMASDRGESVAFTAMYGWNLEGLAELIDALAACKGSCEAGLGESSCPGRNGAMESGIRAGLELEIAEELTPLIDTAGGHLTDYDSVPDKRAVLGEYFASCSGMVSGRKRRVPAADLGADLRRKARWIKEHIRQEEWIEAGDGSGWFNGYYDNAGNSLEGADAGAGAGDVAVGGDVMTLTGQVFTVMGGAARDEQVRKIISAVRKRLADPANGGIRLNTNTICPRPDMGRCFSFAYGHKENGAMFSHMAVMYANALYKRGFASEGRDVVQSVYKLCRDAGASRMYPGIPEYIDARGRGVYHYLTGSASWLLITMISEAYGVRGAMGDLLFCPRLLADEFDSSGCAGVQCVHADRRLWIEYHNQHHKQYGEYRVTAVTVDGAELSFKLTSRGALAPRSAIEALDSQCEHRIRVELG
ncbi:MAG: cellobiose phosphorylase [Clostridia bacterium]|nr:cellobiose phosphorylase [Clostridia bacterium]